MSDTMKEMNPVVMWKQKPLGGGTMKKVICFLLLILLCIGCTNNPTPNYNQWQVALLPDYGPLTTPGTSQDCYEAAKTWCEEKGVDFRVYELKDDTESDRVTAIEQAVADGAKVLLLTGYQYAGPISEVAKKYPEVYFIALNITKADIQWYLDFNDQSENPYPSNLACVTFREEISGYLAGWAAVARGFSNLGILSQYHTPADLRMCYGFLQGADAAAKMLGRSQEVSVRYEFFGNYCSEPESYSAIRDCWSSAGIDTVFAIGNLYIHGSEQFLTNVLETEGKNTILAANSAYTQNFCTEIPETVVVISRINYEATTRRLLTELIEKGKWEIYGGTEARLGLSSEDPAQNELGLLESVTLGDGFTEEDYTALIKALYRGELTVSDTIDNEPELIITVTQDNIRQ